MHMRTTVKDWAGFSRSRDRIQTGQDKLLKTRLAGFRRSAHKLCLLYILLIQPNQTASKNWISKCYVTYTARHSVVPYTNRLHSLGGQVCAGEESKAG